MHYDQQDPGTPHGRRSVRVVLLLGLALTLSLLPAPAASGKGKPGAGPSATLVLRDGALDAVRSDGQGAYPVTVNDTVFKAELSKKRGILLDFSDCVSDPSLSCDGPFAQGAVTGTVYGATLTVYDNQSTGAYYGYASLDFSASGGRWFLTFETVNVTSFDDDGDGNADRFVIEETGGKPAALYRDRSTPFGRGGYWELQGQFDMPFGATISVQTP